MVGQPDTIGSSLNSTESILGSSDTLEDNGELGLGLELLEKIPAKDRSGSIAGGLSVKFKVRCDVVHTRWWYRSEQRGDEQQYQGHQLSIRTPSRPAPQHVS